MKPVSKNVRKALPLLKFIAREPNKTIRKHNLKRLGGDKTVFNAMSEISKNYLNGRIKLKPTHSKLMSRTENKKVLEKFLCDKVGASCHSRKKVLEQSGGFLPYLIPAAATVVDLILSKYIK